jgi:hypothetical protein
MGEAKIKNIAQNDHERELQAQSNIVDVSKIAIDKNAAEEQKPEVKKDKLALVGFAPTTLYLMNEVDPSWEVWGMNELYQLGIPEVAAKVGKALDNSKFTRWIEIHSRAKDKEGKAYCDDVNTETPQGKNHIMNLNNMPFPVYMRGEDMEKYKDVQNSIAFPHRQIVNFFGRKYFTNTVSWMLGFAIMEAFQECGIDTTKPCHEAIKGNIDKLKNFKWKKIAIWGVDMAVGWYKRSNGDDALQNEYASQRPSCEWVIGIVEGLRMAGVDVEIIIPSKSSLLKKFSMYGFEDLDKEVNQIKIDKLERLAFVESQIKSKREQASQLQARVNAELVEFNNKLLVLQGTKQECEMDLAAID